MKLLHENKTYEKWVPVAGRMLLAAPWLVGAFFKMPHSEMFTMQVAATAAVGVPFATAAVLTAFVFEIVAGVAFLIGWKVRTFATVLIPYTILLTALFHSHFVTPYDIGFFVDHLVLIGALCYVSVYGTKHFAVSKD